MDGYITKWGLTAVTTSPDELSERNCALCLLCFLLKNCAMPKISRIIKRRAIIITGTRFLDESEPPEDGGDGDDFDWCLDAGPS